MRPDISIKILHRRPEIQVDRLFHSLSIYHLLDPFIKSYSASGFFEIRMQLCVRENVGGLLMMFIKYVFFWTWYHVSEMCFEWLLSCLVPFYERRPIWLYEATDHPNAGTTTSNNVCADQYSRWVLAANSSLCCRGFTNFTKLILLEFAWNCHLASGKFSIGIQLLYQVRKWATLSSGPHCIF
jgi:hypothetical protein